MYTFEKGMISTEYTDKIDDLTSGVETASSQRSLQKQCH